MVREQRIAIFPGSFNPFTIGHKSVVDRALPLFDRIIVAIGTNAGKESADSDETARRIARLRTTRPQPHL